MCVFVCMYLFCFPSLKWKLNEDWTLTLAASAAQRQCPAGKKHPVSAISHQAEWHFLGRSATVAGMRAAPAWFLRNWGPLVHSMLFSKAKPRSKVSHLHKLNSVISEGPPWQPTEAVNNRTGFSTILFVSVALLRYLSAYYHTFRREILPYGFISSYWNPQTRSPLIFSLSHCSGTSNGPPDWCLLLVHAIPTTVPHKTSTVLANTSPQDMSISVPLPTWTLHFPGQENFTDFPIPTFLLHFTVFTSHQFPASSLWG